MILRKDLPFLLGLMCFFLPFFIFKELFEAYYQFNLEHGLLMSFIKFAILATLGEVIGLRIKTGNYHQKPRLNFFYKYTQFIGQFIILETV